MAKYILLFVALSFALTVTASAAMACCWNISQNEMAADLPCHNLGDIDESDSVPFDCCDDMALCEMPLIYDSVDAARDMLFGHETVSPILLGWVFIDSVGPPHPPPKLFL